MQLLAAQFPELLELLLLLLLSRLLSPSLLLLLIPRLFNRRFELLPTALLLLKESKGLLLGLLYLLVQDFILPVLHVAEDLSLALDQALAGLLLFPEFLLLLVLLQLVESRLLTGVLLYLGLFLLLLLGELGLLDLKLLVCLSEGLHLLERLLLALGLLVGLARQLFLDLAVDELGLEDLVLHPLDILHLELVQLLVDDLCVGHLALVLVNQLLLDLLVEGLHLGVVKLQPLLVDAFLVIRLPLLDGQLDLTLCQHVTHQQLRLEGLDLVLTGLGVPVRLLNCLHACLHLQGVLSRVNAAAL